mgnify:CR=1 FL=1
MWMNSVPRFYEKVWSSIEPLPADQQAQRLKRIFGPRIRHLSSGGAPLPKHIGAVFAQLGMPIYEGYGLTETAPIVSLNHPFGTKKGSVGKAMAGVDIKIAPDGEILVRGDNVTSGYFQPGTTAGSAGVASAAGGRQRQGPAGGSHPGGGP